MKKLIIIVLVLVVLYLLLNHRPKPAAPNKQTQIYTDPLTGLSNTPPAIVTNEHLGPVATTIPVVINTPVDHLANNNPFIQTHTIST